MSETESSPGPDGGGEQSYDATAASTPNRRSRQRDGGYRHTRTSGAWAAVTVAVVIAIALVDFIAQNTRDVRIEFFTVSGRVPIAVALLAAAVAGAIVVLAVGIGRVAQLRLQVRRQRRWTKAAKKESTGDAGGPNGPEESTSE